MGRPLARIGLALLCAAVLVGCFVRWSWLHQTGEVGYAAMVAHPERFAGEEVALSLVRVVAVDGPDRYSVEKSTLRMAVRGDGTARTVGEEISVGGRWVAEEGWLEEAWVQPRTGGRRAKRVLGVVGLVVAFGLVGASIRRSPEGLALRG